MSQLKSSILILGASSFLAKPLIKKLEDQDFFKIICQSRSNLRYEFNTKSDIKFLAINYKDIQGCGNIKFYFVSFRFMHRKKCFSKLGRRDKNINNTYQNANFFF